jgi:hypothetical protein
MAFHPCMQELQIQLVHDDVPTRLFKEMFPFWYLVHQLWGADRSDADWSKLHYRQTFPSDSSLDRRSLIRIGFAAIPMVSNAAIAYSEDVSSGTVSTPSASGDEEVLFSSGCMLSL